MTKLPVFKAELRRKLGMRGVTALRCCRFLHFFVYARPRSHLHLRLHVLRNLRSIDEHLRPVLRDHQVRYRNRRVRNVVSADVEYVCYLQDERFVYGL